MCLELASLGNKCLCSEYDHIETIKEYTKDELSLDLTLSFKCSRDMEGKSSMLM